MRHDQRRYKSHVPSTYSPMIQQLEDLVHPKKAFARIKATASILDGFRIHELSHAFAPKSLRLKDLYNLEPANLDEMKLSHCSYLSRKTLNTITSLHKPQKAPRGALIKLFGAGAVLI